MMQTRHVGSTASLWLGSSIIAGGVAVHLPMFFFPAAPICRVSNLSADSTMVIGMGLIVVGTLMVAYGLLRPDHARPAAASVRQIVPVRQNAHHPDRLTFAHWQLLAALVAALVIDTMKPASIGFVVPGMRAEYHLTRAAVGLLPFSALSGTMIGSWLWGVLADAAGRRAAILLAGTLFVGTSICGAMPTFAGNVVMCFIMGLSAGGMAPIAFTLLSEAMPAPHRGWSLVLLGGIGTVGGYLVASLCAAWLEPRFGWRILWLLGLPSGLLLIALNRFIPESADFLAMTGRTLQARQTLSRFGERFKSNASRLSATARRPSINGQTTAVGTSGQVLDEASTPGIATVPWPTEARREASATTSLLSTTVSLNTAGLAWGLVSFGLILWLPTDLRAHGYSIGGSDTMLARSSFLALPTIIPAAWLYVRWGAKKTLMLLYMITVFSLLGIAILGQVRDLPAPLVFLILTGLMTGANGIVAVLLPYSTELYPTAMRGRGVGMVAGSGKLGGVAAQVLGMAALVPPMSSAAMILAMPVLLSAAMSQLFGRKADRALLGAD